MIEITGTTHTGVQISASVPYLLDDGFDEAALRAAATQPGRLVFAWGGLHARSSRSNDAQAAAASTCASRWLRQRCARLQDVGGMRLAGHVWSRVQRAEISPQALDDMRADLIARQGTEDEDDS